MSALELSRAQQSLFTHWLYQWESSEWEENIPSGANELFVGYMRRFLVCARDVSTFCHLYQLCFKHGDKKLSILCLWAMILPWQHTKADMGCDHTT